MGLRVNTNVPALRTLRLLDLNDRAQARSLERLSTGLRINRASDDPAGLVRAEQLRGQIGALNQAIENTVSASNMMSTAEAALQQVSDLLIEVQDSVVFALSGSASPSQIAAEQAALDQSIEAINRIASTTRFGDRSLLNGTNDFLAGGPGVAAVPDAIDDLKIRGIVVAPGASSTSVTLTVNTAPLRGSLQYVYAVGSTVAAGTVMRVTGPRGTEDITLPSGVVGTAGAANLVDAINSVAGNTGVFASSSAVGTAALYTDEFGRAQSVRTEVISGSITVLTSINYLNDLGVYAATGLGVDQVVGEVATDLGLDGIMTVDGQSFAGTGRFFQVTTPRISMEFSLDPTNPVAAGALPAFTVRNNGLLFQVGELPRPSDRIAVGIENLSAGSLGITTFEDRIQQGINGAGTGDISATTVTKGGYLASLRAGGANDLDTNAGNAQSIVVASIDQVSRLRGFLGSVQSKQLDALSNVSQIRAENLNAELSNIRDLNFAAETTAFTRTQILFQAGIASLASANLIPQSILTLLG